MSFEVTLSHPTLNLMGANTYLNKVGKLFMLNVSLVSSSFFDFERLL